MSEQQPRAGAPEPSRYVVDEPLVPQWEQTVRPTPEPTPRGTGRATLVVLALIVIAVVAVLAVIMAKN
jgi:hypothetical protein